MARVICLALFAALAWASVLGMPAEPEKHVDVADLQNIEDDDDQFPADCSEGQAFVRHFRNCRLYYRCAHGVGHLQKCPRGLYFDSQTQVCDYQSKVDCKSPWDLPTRRRIGRFSLAGESTSSNATCPRGYVPVTCTSSDPRRSTGTVVTDRMCESFNSESGAPQRAVVICASAGEEDYVFVNSGFHAERPSVQCPDDYRIVNCFIRRNGGTEPVFAFIRAGKGTCRPDVPCAAGGCSVQAVCRRKNILTVG